MSDLPGTGAGTTSFEPTVPAPPGDAAAPGGGRGGKRPAPVLAVVTCALALAAAAGAVAVLTHRPHHAPPSHPLRGTVFQLRPGQCLNFPPNGTAVAHVIPCAQPHDAEIYGSFRVAGHRWPGDAVLNEQARQDCQGKLSGYLNQLSLSNVAEFYVYPGRGAWAAGGRSVICEIRGTQGKLTGFVRPSGS
jgi:hypothetical protein